MKKYIIIVAGGKGTRMKSAVPKQFIELQGKPILMHTIEKFVKTVPGIHVIVALAKDLHKEWFQLCKKYRFQYTIQLADGGETRFHSVKSGLKLVPENCVVGIHDAARPFVSEQAILNVFETAEKKGNACLSIPLNESIREVGDDGNRAVDRSKVMVVQTPQCFHSNILKKAFLQEYQTTFTDDATVAEASGVKINLILGNAENIKITTPLDLTIAEAVLKKIR